MALFTVLDCIVSYNASQYRTVVQWLTALVLYIFVQAALRPGYDNGTVQRHGRRQRRAGVFCILINAVTSSICFLNCCFCFCYFVLVIMRGRTWKPGHERGYLMPTQSCYLLRVRLRDSLLLYCTVLSVLPAPVVGQCLDIASAGLRLDMGRVVT